MPNIPMFTAPTPAQTLAPQPDPTMPNQPSQGSATQSFMDPTKLAALLGKGGQGSGMPDPMSGAPAGVNNISGAPQSNPTWLQQLSTYFGNFGGGS